MLTSLLVASIAAAPAAVDAKVSSASLFKNGYAVVVREAPLASGETIVQNVPQAALGTLWITGSKGVRFEQVLGTSHTTRSQAAAQSLDQILAANVGKTVRLQVDDKEHVGKILSATGNVVVFESAQGVTVFSKASIRSIRGGKDLVWKTNQDATQRVYKIRANAPAGSKVYILSLERGLTWAPGYAADITRPLLDLTGKATLINDLADLDGIDVRLITGFPNLPFINILDPFSLSQSVDQFTSSLMNMGTPGRFRGPGVMMQNVMGQARAAESFDQGFSTESMSGMQQEDLFFYTIPKVSMKKGDRGYFVLFSFSTPFEHVYEWEVQDQVQDMQYRPTPDQPEDVWHSLKFKNAAKLPLTTAAAITTKDGEILGQDILNFTNPGSETSLKITKALDIVAETIEEEISRERKTIAWAGSSNYPFDHVRLKGTLSLRNLKQDSVKIGITKQITGEVVEAEADPQVTKLAKGLAAVNPRQRLKWTVDLKPGERREIHYTYTVYIRT